MSYKDFRLEDAIDRLQLRLVERALFRDIPAREPSAWLAEALREGAPLALSLGNEKARSELIIAPVLLEVRRVLLHKVSLFTGIELDVDASIGLNGVCDWLLSRSPEQILLRAPVVAVVEAKQENIRGGLGQCVAEMVAAQRFNERAKLSFPRVYGAVTTGDNWRFLSLEGDGLSIDVDEYQLPEIAKVLGIFVAIVAE
jgi:hypothetical protein